MLNLSQIQSQVNSGPRPVANVANPTGEASVMSDLYRELKSLGWQSTGTVHPADRVSLLTLGSATIRRDRDAAPGCWIVDVAGGEFRTSDPVSALTARVNELQAASVETAPDAVSDDERISPKSPAADAADALTAELTAAAPAIAKRIADRLTAGLALVEADAISQYNTTWDNAGKDGCWSCDCPAAQYRVLNCKYGRLCKHTAAGMIRQRIAQAQAVTTAREVEKRNERRAQFATDPAPGDAGRLASDYETMQTTPRMRQELEREAARREAIAGAERVLAAGRAKIAATQAGYDAALKADPLNTTGYSQNFNRQVSYGR